MTGAQRSYLKTLSEPFDENLTKQKHESTNCSAKPDWVLAAADPIKNKGGDRWVAPFIYPRSYLCAQIRLR
jgi:hypothetical protein